MEELIISYQGYVDDNCEQADISINEKNIINDLNSDNIEKIYSTYDNILRVVKDIPEIADPIRFLRAREIVHFQRFGEAIQLLRERLDQKNVYATNPAFEVQPRR